MIDIAVRKRSNNSRSLLCLFDIDVFNVILAKVL